MQSYGNEEGKHQRENQSLQPDYPGKVRVDGIDTPAILKSHHYKRPRQICHAPPRHAILMTTQSLKRAILSYRKWKIHSVAFLWHLIINQ